ncbi:hypothetical protein AZ19_1366 [Bordetella bronchiseptica E012]|uniref:Uncharacterized protein n=1 Tax=Bordetella bronchiseptica 00-P-2796 TaxID=1331199 RepID=A0ABR4RAS3_BORBO|nr:hypothetical protein L490_1095 [Bordetella bronchiseptica 00-P-2796]KDB99817.1 hypothetical protein AZ18_1364 [Bordetella bronchiseptica D993]KDC01297.1 hypothetical protein AZ23_1371 [Bordetella bronchiseptica E010]KDC03282.1 hypothetical protein AZ19_1366 [Bordetella bronchiseptica E012]KDD36157.1 hypothetical protein L527_1320 [Bordetella bronchiseptica MBORD839]
MKRPPHGAAPGGAGVARVCRNPALWPKPRRAWAVGGFESFQTVRGFFRCAAGGAKTAQEL